MFRIENIDTYHNSHRSLVFLVPRRKFRIYQSRYQYKTQRWATDLGHSSYEMGRMFLTDFVSLFQQNQILKIYQTSEFYSIPF